MSERHWSVVEASGEPDTAHKIVVARRRMARDDTEKFADSCVSGELILAAMAYLVSPGDAIWPFDPQLFSPEDPAENMVKAGALLAAEGDRIRRAQLAGEPVTTGLVLLGLDAEQVEDCVEGLRNVQEEMRRIREEASENPSLVT